MFKPTRSIIHSLAFSVLCTTSFISQAATKNDAPETVKSAIIKSIKAGYNNLEVSSIELSPIEGLYKVKLSTNQQVLFASADGQFFIAGDMYTLEGSKFINLQKPERIADTLAAVKKEDMIIYSPKGEVKGVIYVFTDVDCPYCEKLHHQVPTLNDKGIEVRYLAYPRAGLYTPSYTKIASAWCSDDPHKALGEIQHGHYAKLDDDCDTTVIDQQFAIGNRVGVTGTPTIVFSDGSLLSGYQSPEKLEQLINEKNK